MATPTDTTTTDSAEAPDYRPTLFLPQTDFPMKAGLPKREPEILARWSEMDLYARLREARKDAPVFSYHDGPPYANGNLHMGHALNKILKDMVCRSQSLLGRNAAFVPGWDCHGLPIEWKVEEKYRNAGKNKDEVPVLEFRQECRDFAAHWVDVQREEFQRLGVLADWKRPYTTMSNDAEASIVAEFLKFAMSGALYQGSKPVMWSTVEKTALAEAEVEYHDHNSPTIYLAFPVQRSKNIFLSPSMEQRRAHLVIWTTTPWTIPANRAIAYAEHMTYVLVEAGHEGPQGMERKAYVVAEPLLETFLKETGLDKPQIVQTFSGKELEGTVCAHPLRGQGYEFDVPALAGDFVTDEQGTGFVHVAPGHGQDDYILGMKHGIEVPHTVGEDGTYYDHVPLFAGRQVLLPNGKNGDANKTVMEALGATGHLVASGRLQHSYPHSWRSKAPLIFRNTPQWFISMSHDGLRDKALAAIDTVKWYPARGQARIRSMVETRPDWVVSRQRAWGVPLTIFVHKETGEILRDDEVNKRVTDAVAERGCDAWYDTDPQAFLGNDYKADDYDQVMDILDVWFDSGSTHAFVLEGREDQAWPATLYLEGSDQHRGWFQSSLLESCGTRGRAPYDQVVTHGFILDETGKKMSKSGKNAMSPEKIIQQSGAEILRIWVASSDYQNDLVVGPNIIKACTDSYRKLRNTIRFLLGNLAGFEESERVSVEDMKAAPESEGLGLELFVLHRLAELDQLVREGYETYDFTRVFHALTNFCVTELSAFYFDIRKDALYCDAPDSLRRRAARTVMDQVFACLTAWLAPVLSFTMEEAWLSRFPEDDGSVHLRTFPDVPADWKNDAIAARWQRLRQFRRVVTGALEIERREKRIGASLEGAPHVYVEDDAIRAALGDVPLDDLCITSALTVMPADDTAPADAFRLDDVAGVAVVPVHAEGEKCARCWKILPDVNSVPAHPGTCGRCAGAVSARADAAE
ncbi:isoleucine--tRNA ligase [Pyruvatibacter mobilis]|mgnify:CR=1 FL=1|uniref:isoleucine--tRNA ligase n=1 Tax=Pyruvatibacter mobilis TaxID=1712261 RepID=UPI003BA97CD1